MDKKIHGYLDRQMDTRYNHIDEQIDRWIGRKIDMQIYKYMDVYCID